MSDMSHSQSPLNGAQILARLESLERGVASSVTGMIRPLNVPIGIAIIASQSIQDARIAQGWCVPAAVNLARYTFAR